MSSSRHQLMADLDTEYKGSSGQIDEVGYSILGTRYMPTMATIQTADSALSRSRSVLHARAKSLASFVPRLGAIAGPTTERTTTTRSQPNRLFGDIFSGESAPVRLGVATASPTKDEKEHIIEYASHFTARPDHSLKRRPTKMDEPESSRKSWFSRKSTTIVPTESSLADDEILKIDINTALFPYGPPDAHSPHAFNDLLLNATALLDKMQTAYREKATQLAGVQPEMEAQREEVEEVETRSRHLKLQLEGMCRKAEEQDRTMKEMAEEFAIEKLRFQEERDRATNSIRLVKEQAVESTSHAIGYGTARSRRKRLSAGSHATDSGFESNSDTFSMFSGDGREEAETQHLRANGVHYAESFNSGHSRSTDTSAWAFADALKHENQLLRAELDAMQRDLQGCIDMVETVMI